MVKKEEVIAEREGRRRKDKEATAKSFFGLQERSVAVAEAIAKARLLEAEGETKALEAEAKARLLEAEARTKLLEAEAKTKLLEAEATLIDEENKIMLTDLECISDPNRREWFEKRQKMI
jgi:cellobiose-specific phosphotransferase system component IIA